MNLNKPSIKTEILFPPINLILSKRPLSKVAKLARSRIPVNRACPLGPALVVQWNLLHLKHPGAVDLLEYPNSDQKSFKYFRIKSLMVLRPSSATIVVEVILLVSGIFPILRALVEKRMVSTTRRTSKCSGD